MAENQTTKELFTISNGTFGHLQYNVTEGMLRYKNNMTNESWEYNNESDWLFGFYNEAAGPVKDTVWLALVILK